MHDREKGRAIFLLALSLLLLALARWSLFTCFGSLHMGGRVQSLRDSESFVITLTVGHDFLNR